MHRCNAQADRDEKTLRISLDTKAKIKLGEYSRGGAARGREAPKAWDHDMKPSSQWVPVGILEPVQEPLTLLFSDSIETSDLLVDCLEIGWSDNGDYYAAIEEIVINLDCGPHVNSHRTQFMNRLVAFSKQIGRRIHLVYYPPYHSKYNPIERCWGVLEQHWNGALLDSVDTTLNWAGTMTWRGIQPVIHFIDRVYERGVKLTKKAMAEVEKKLNRSNELPKWEVIIEPT